MKFELKATTAHFLAIWNYGYFHPDFGNIYAFNLSQQNIELNNDW